MNCAVKSKLLKLIVPFATESVLVEKNFLDRIQKVLDKYDVVISTDDIENVLIALHEVLEKES